MRAWCACGVIVFNVNCLLDDCAVHLLVDRVLDGVFSVVKLLAALVSRLLARRLASSVKLSLRLGNNLVKVNKRRAD